ncbi:MAG: DEAD/DEAH box helicase family protein, partial [Lentisphaerae bacterium]|nr:DEAD/DEAH box helicase family protein [Lentisphaerota bacterium]
MESVNTSTATSTAIKTTRTVYPQIYAYVTPNYPDNEGWIKIGYTEQRDVEKRIRQQTQTAGIRYDKLWSGPAKFTNSNTWFKDKELHSYLRKFKDIKQRPGSEWFYYDGYPEQAQTDFEEFRRKDWSQAAKSQEYTLRAEQEDAVQKTLTYIAGNPKNREFLWNAKPRFGKTLTAYDLALRLQARNVLIVTNRPAIANSWFDDFATFIAWRNDAPWLFISTTDSLKDRPVLTHKQFINHPYKPDGQLAGHMAFISLQDLKGSIHFGGPHGKLEWVKQLEWDLLIIDEAHEGVDTFIADIALNNITRNFTLHLSGTPFRAIASGNFSADQIYNWSYADEQAAKEAWQKSHDEYNPYEGLPRLNMFSYQMSQMITDEVNKGAEIDGTNIDYAFDLNEFFATNDSGKFQHEAEVVKWLDTLTRNEKYPFSTPELRAELKHTFWLLNRVASAKALEKLLKNHPVFENYEVIIAAGDGRSDKDDPAVTERSLDRVRAAIAKNDRTITLSVGQLTTGVTVPEWTAVMMLSNVKSASLYMQAAFRAQNPWSYEINGESQRKHNAYVFDFAPERTLIIYDEFANNLLTTTAAGGGTTSDREENIRKLLNFFPVIAEDDSGKMIELDVNQVLTIPK